MTPQAELKSYCWRDGWANDAWRSSLLGRGSCRRAGRRAPPNGVEWVCFDQVDRSAWWWRRYTTDNPENIAYILADCGARLLLVGEVGQWQALAPLRARFPQISRVLCLGRDANALVNHGAGLRFTAGWLPAETEPVPMRSIDPNRLATIIYTSGTTGRPKGVMLSHRNILSNAEAVTRVIPVYREDVFLSFLPISHAFERTAGYYVPIMAGSCVAYARSIQDLPEDLLALRPTVLMSYRVSMNECTAGSSGNRDRGCCARSSVTPRRRLAALRDDAGRGGDGITRLAWPVLRRPVTGKVLSRWSRLRLAVTAAHRSTP
jgi:long-chain acyl-CoA synthetase